MVDHTIVHFEIPADNVDRLRKFYSELFGWKIEKTPGPAEYWGIQTVPVDEHAKKIEALGGRVVVPKMEVPGICWWALALDPEGNQFAIMQRMV